ncbi:sugar phosphate isomerase/epimerase family protein [Pseudarthrobacter sp. NPDC055928]|uniref:sugar phosphate isomerase/epimerase family protein n=1 Tax=Pseudarthrobacter sp. NPDC055928 TaxID=3345661 RepID=UPI0035DB3AF1
MAYSLTLCAMNLPDVRFDTRVRLAQNAGFSSIGLSIAQYRRAREDGFTDDQMRTLLSEAGIHLDEVEGPWDWLTGEGSSAKDTELVLHIVRKLNCRQITAVQFHPASSSSALVTAAQSLCDSAAQLGARVGIEFLPFSLLPSLSDAWRLVHEVDRENCGLVLDAWHFARTTGWQSTLETIPAERLYAIQLCDAADIPSDDLREEARHRRLLPGQISIEILRKLRGLGFSGRLSTEVWSDELFRSDPELAVPALHKATVEALRAADWPEDD